MLTRAISIIAAGIWATALFAQSVPLFPGLPQFTTTPKTPRTTPEMTRALRQMLKKYASAQPAVCSILLLQVQVTKNLEKMPVLEPRRDLVDNMPVAKMPAPPCEEEKR